MSFDVSDFARQLGASVEQLTEVLADGCAEFAEEVGTRSDELCPVSPSDPNHELYKGHSGQLRDSRTVKDPVIEDGKITVEIGYNTDYDSAVHERLDLNHNYPGAVNPDAQAKFLETAMGEKADQLIPFLERKARGVFRG